MIDIHTLAECPECHAPWHYQSLGETFSRVMGIEIQGGFDGVSYWQCPACSATWDRWTGAKVDSTWT